MTTLLIMILATTLVVVAVRLRSTLNASGAVLTPAELRRKRTSEILKWAGLVLFAAAFLFNPKHHP